jgi:type VI secretion system protein ImpH
MAAESGPQGPDVMTDDVPEGGDAVAVNFVGGNPVADILASPTVEADKPDYDLPDVPAEDVPGRVAEPKHFVQEYYGAEVSQEMREEPWNFQFFQAVRLLERFGTGKPVGRFDNPEDEAVRFAVNPALVFPPSEIHSLKWPDGGQPQMSVNFMGLLGPLGVMPLPYSEWVNERIRSKDHTLRSFFDLFHHRILSLFYQAWEKYRFPVAFERDRDDRFTRYLLDFIGLGTSGLRNRLSLPDEALVFYTGLLAMQSRSATALRQVLQDYFQVGVEVQQFVGTWRAIPASDQSRPGDEREFSEQLSLGAIAGDEVWDQQCTARVVLGPLTLKQYLDFLPIGSGYKPLCDLTEFFSRREIDFELQLTLRRDETPGVVLDYEGLSNEPLLGWTTWLKNAPMGRDPADTILQLQ